MQYRKNRLDEPISLLGFGCMRFTRKAGKIDIDKAEKEILRAVEAGVNYFDTAYMYPGSEAALGEIVERNDLRDKINIATKLPQYMVKTAGQIDKYFEEECKRLRTDYVDYYLMHMISDIGAWEKLERLGIKDWIKEKKAEGRIKNIGFSFHGSTENFIEVIDAYDWDFCMIQYNYMDEHSQAGRRGLQYASAKGLPVMIMEPLRGGKLVNLMPKDAKALIAGYEKKRTPAEWAFRWLMQQPEVSCVLSGMNSMEMLEENLRIADEVQIGEFDEGDYKLIDDVKAIINAGTKVNCTACRYCMPCPGHIDIPAMFHCYNTMYSESKMGGRREHLQAIILQKEASKCINCGKCEAHCPQKLEVRAELAKAQKALEPWYMKAVLAGGKAFRKYMYK